MVGFGRPNCASNVWRSFTMVGSRPPITIAIVWPAPLAAYVRPPTLKLKFSAYACRIWLGASPPTDRRRRPSSASAAGV
jgi:hypothetical protein